MFRVGRVNCGGRCSGVSGYFFFVSFKYIKELGWSGDL